MKQKHICEVCGKKLKPSEVKIIYIFEEASGARRGVACEKCACWLEENNDNIYFKGRKQNLF